MTQLEILSFFTLILVYHFILEISRMNFLMLGEGPSFGSKGSFGSPDKKISIKFSKANTKFTLSLHFNTDNGYLFVNEKEKPTIKMLTFQLNFVLEVYLMGLVLLSLKKSL